MKKKDVTKWTNADVVKWLTLIGFSQYKGTHGSIPTMPNKLDSFVQNDISGRNLRALTANSLKSEMNIQSLGHRSLLLEAIKKLYRKLEDSPPRKYGNFTEISSNLYRTSKGEVDMENEILAGKLAVRETWEIDKSELKMCEMLGKGFFGEVRRAIWNGTEVAVKEIYKYSFSRQKSNSQKFIWKTIRLGSVL